MYRVKQFFGALTAEVDDDDERVLDRLLTPPQRSLFRRMAPNDQRHGIEVLHSLHQAGNQAPDLLVAALLHDAGKAAGRIRLWQRTLIVLLERWAPSVLDWLARDACYTSAPWWRRGFVINRIHPELGAHWAAEAGCSPATVALIRRHHVPVTSIKTDQDRLLAALQWADGVN